MTFHTLDLEALLDYVDGDEAFASELATLFLDAAPEWMRRLGDAMAAGALPEVRREAHRLRGSLATFFAPAATAAAEALEAAGDGAAAAGAWARLRAEVARLSPELRALASAADPARAAG